MNSHAFAQLAASARLRRSGTSAVVCLVVLACASDDDGVSQQTEDDSPAATDAGDGTSAESEQSANQQSGNQSSKPADADAAAVDTPSQTMDPGDDAGSPSGAMDSSSNASAGAASDGAMDQGAETDNVPQGNDAGTGSSSSSEPGQWEEVRLAGWFQHIVQSDSDPGVDQQSGSFIETDWAQLPDSCDGQLGAAPDAPGLAYTYFDGRPKYAFLDPGELSTRPGAGEVTPLYWTALHGELRSNDARDGYSREYRLFDQQSTETVYISTCMTTYRRKGCYIPGPDFLFAGCYGVPSVNPDVLIVPEIVDDDRVWSATFSTNTNCSTESFDATHPDEAERGIQTIEVNYGGLEEGQSVELPPDAVSWSSSYLSEYNCSYIQDYGDQCDCTWSYEEHVDIAYAVATKVDGKLNVEIRSPGDEPEYFVWARQD